MFNKFSFIAKYRAETKAIFGQYLAYQQIADTIAVQVQQMGEDVARKRPFKDKKHEMTYTEYQRHYEGMTKVLKAKFYARRSLVSLLFRGSA